MRNTQCNKVAEKTKDIGLMRIGVKFLIKGDIFTFVTIENGYYTFELKGNLVSMNYLDFDDLYALGMVEVVK